jgi:hypothetical protein
VAGFLEREGLLVRDDDNDYLALDGLKDAPMLQIQGYFITYRIAIGKQQGRKVFTLQTNYCTYGRTGACDRLCRKCGRLQSPCRCHEQCTG